MPYKRQERHPCYQWTGRRKIRHRSLAAAERHAKQLTRYRNQWTKAYACPLEPGIYHVGAQPLRDLSRAERVEIYRQDKRTKSRNEALAGQVIAALITCLRRN